MKLTVLVPALAGLLWAGSALADAQLEVTNPYVAQLIDGQPINPKLLDKSNTYPIKAGDHQLVVAFEGNYSSRSDIKLVTAEPLVINFTAADNQKLVLDFKKPRNESEAKQFVKDQKVVLKDKNSGQIVASEQFVMPKVEGFQLTRDYQQELLGMGKAFNQPTTVAVSTAAVMAAASAPVQVAPSKAQSNPEALTQLQSWYNKADAETRKAFQIWVIQQQYCRIVRNGEPGSPFSYPIRSDTHATVHFPSPLLLLSGAARTPSLSPGKIPGPVSDAQHPGLSAPGDTSRNPSADRPGSRQ